MALPLLTIVFGLMCIITKKYNHTMDGPSVEGPLVVFVGKILCLFGLFGVVATARERKKHRGGSPSDDSNPGSNV
jgi:hypothetical protein